MNTQKNNQSKLIAAIIFSSVIISAALVYAGYSFRGNGSESVFSGESGVDKLIDEGINRYVKKQEEMQREKEKPKKIEGVSADDDPVIGNEDAPVTIVEFSDYQCPYCKRSFDQVLPKIKEKYINTGKAKLVFRDFPLDFHPYAFSAALASECADEQGKFMSMHDKIFNNQDKIEKDDLKKYAGEIGLNTAKFNNCLDSEKYKEEVEKDISDGAALGVSGTPSYFINGWRLVGAQPFSEFEKYIEQELNK